jgi:hypothetical protein
MGEDCMHSFFGQWPLVPLPLLGPPFFPIILFGSTTLLTGMTGNSLHMQWPLTSHLHGSVSQREQLVFQYRSNSMPFLCAFYEWGSHNKKALCRMRKVEEQQLDETLFAQTKFALIQLCIRPCVVLSARSLVSLVILLRAWFACNARGLSRTQGDRMILWIRIAQNEAICVKSNLFVCPYFRATCAFFRKNYRK